MRGIGLMLPVACLLALPGPTAASSVLLGPTDLSGSPAPFASCDALAPDFCTARTYIPTSLGSAGGMLVVPADGTITSWRVKGAPPGKLRLRVVRSLGDGGFKAIATSGIARVSDGVSDNKAAIGVAAGSQLGIEVTNEPLDSVPATLQGNLAVPGASWSAFTKRIADGSSGNATELGSGSLPLFNATVELHAPEIFKLSSNAGPQTGGAVVAIGGAHLAIATRVSFGDAPARILDSGPTQTLVETPPHPPGSVEVALETAAGSSAASAVARYTYLPVAAPAPDTAGPQLSSLSLRPYAFEARDGARLAFRSSEAGTLRIAVQRKGRRAPFRPLPGTLTATIDAGRNSIRVPGTWRGRRLRPGRHRIVAVASDALGNRSKPRHRGFKVLEPGSRRR